VITSLVLFTRDLRVHDHPALARACASGDEVVPLFVLDPRLLGRSPNRDRFLLECLDDLDAAIARRGGGLVVRSGETVRRTVEVARQAGCSTVYVGADVSAYAKARERELRAALAGAGIELRPLGVNGVVEPGELAPAGRSAYRVFTPYYRAWAARPTRSVLPAPRRIVTPAIDRGNRPAPSSVAPDAADAPRGGERAGRRRMHAFVGRELGRYGDARNDLAGNGTSRLSPYLRFGCVSVNELAARASRRGGADALRRELAWRDFFRQLLADDPSIARHDLRAASGSAPVPSPGALEAWREGRTGVPLVDAGMRQLAREGWMHNRARLVTASFLTRRLGVPWREGERHFARLLFDGDPGSNAGNWQWTAGTGTDPRRTRTLDPVLQARRYDPSGEYVRRYVPELRGVDPPALFTPWRDAAVLNATGYPRPIVDVPA
jgi:deoxyribodipyrimidine photo-lyase